MSADNFSPTSFVIIQLYVQRSLIISWIRRISDASLSLITPIKSYLAQLSDKRSIEIMLKHATPEKVIHFTWLFVAVTFCWPISSKSSKSQHLRLSVMQIIGIIHAILLIVPSIYSVFVYISMNDIMRFYRCLLQLIACIQMVVQTSICFIKHDSLQISGFLFHSSISGSYYSFEYGMITRQFCSNRHYYTQMYVCTILSINQRILNKLWLPFML